jgi:putative MFS transporter
MASTIIDDARLTGFHQRLTLYSAGGPFLDGYILSIIGIALVQVTPQLHVSPVWAGLIGASALMGVFVGGLIFGYITDVIGRQLMYTVDLIAIIVCSVLQFFAVNVVELFVLRLIIGIAVGADYPIATALLAEFAPRRQRGPMLGVLVVMWFVGATVAYFVGNALLAVGPSGWRWMLLSPAFPALAVVLMRLGTPESARWLLNKGRVDEAREVLKRVYGPHADVTDVPTEAEPTRFSRIWQGGYLLRTAYVGIFWTCAIVPLFAIYAFGPEILGAFKLTGSQANIGSALISLLFLIGCVLALPAVNILGRRPMIIWTFFFSALGLLVLGLWPTAPVAVIALAFVVYAVFIGGPQIMEWVYPNELFPTDVRATAVGVGTALSRIGAAIGTFIEPIALDRIGIGVTMLIAAAITFAGFGASLAWAPETKGKTLAEASEAAGAPAVGPAALAGGEGQPEG